MASNLDYLDPNLLPLEEKVKAYLEAEEDLRKATVEARSLPTTEAAEQQAAQQFEQRPATGSFDQHEDELEQRMVNMHNDLAELRREILALLPVRDEFVKVNLGYGPSRVGAFSIATSQGSDFELRIVH